MSQTLGIVDCIIWALVILCSMGIGVYFGFFTAKKRNHINDGTETAEFLLGGRNMNPIPVACSLLASFFSAITLLGTPNEIYQYGTMYWYIGIAYIFTIIISAELFIPVFFNLRITSSYQYLGFRFSKINQVMSATAFIFQMAPYMGIVIYGPSLALRVVINVNLWVIVIVTCSICIVYTTIGGIKAVIWTDVLQLAMMFCGLLVIFINESYLAGGFNKIMKTAIDHERTNFYYSADMRQRNTIWSLVIGGTFLWCGIYSINQTMIQRAVCIKTLKHAKLAYYLNLPGMNLLLIFVALCGLALFNAFYGCDPIIGKEISKSDQILPYYVSKYLLKYPGIGGIFIAGIFSGSLSTLSSGFNSLAAVTLNDIIMLKYTSLNDRTAANITKSLVVCYGILTILFAYLSSLTSKILEAALGLFGMLAGPSLGVFTLGMFLPFANYKGAISGHIIAQIIIFWIGFGFYSANIRHPTLTLSNFNCSGKGNITKLTGHDITSFGKPLNGINNLYAISYLWYTFISWAIVLIVGIPVSLLTKSDTDLVVKSEYISPVFRRFWFKDLDDEIVFDQVEEKIVEKEIEVTEENI